MIRCNPEGEELGKSMTVMMPVNMFFGWTLPCGDTEPSKTVSVMQHRAKTVSVYVWEGNVGQIN